MATDNFNRSNESPLASPWVQFVGAGAINLSSNAITSTADIHKIARYTSGASSADQFSQITIASLSSNSNFGPAVRVSAGPTIDGYFYMCFAGGPGIAKWSNAAFTRLSNGPGVSAGDVVKITVSGTTIRSYINGSETSGSPVTDSEFSSGQPGVMYYDAGGSLDDWSGGDLTTGYTLAADAGTYALTGTAASPKAARRASAGGGTYATTGSTARLLEASRLPAAAGAYALTGTAATGRATRRLDATAGSYALTGSAVTLTTSQILAATAGSYSLTGQAATLRLARRVAAVTGSYAATGVVTTLTKSRVLSVNAGAYATTGSAATLRTSRRLAAVVGAYALTGQAASLLKGRSLAAVAGAYSLTGSALTVRWAHRLDAVVGLYLVSGADAVLLYSGLGAPPEIVLRTEVGTRIAEADLEAWLAAEAETPQLRGAEAQRGVLVGG